MASNPDASPAAPIVWSEHVDPERVIGLGVAGNFAGHLEQAGEASDFVDVRADAGAPKGVFPFYVPGGDPGDHFLHRFPLSDRRLRLGSLEEKHQVEPEVALLFALDYAGAGAERRVHALRPVCAMAHNDCSIRREGARKISEKKNWGPETKGTAAAGIPVDRFAEGGVLDRFRLASLLVRDGHVHDYGLDSPLTGPDGYSYFYQQLVDWLVERLARQRDEGPLEDVARWIARAGFPDHALISVGATRYTEFGETTFLRPDDRVVVALYDGARYAPTEIRDLAADPDASSGPGLSLLVQQVSPNSV